MLPHPPASDLAGVTALGWEWRPEVALPLLLVLSAYAFGSWRLARRGQRARRWRHLAAAGGALGVAAALLSPLDGLAHHLFSAHMLQHMLLIVVAAPAVLLADPFPAFLWALPESLRAAAGRLVRPGAGPRRLGSALARLPVAWSAHVLVLWLWHLPVAYDLTLRDRLVHDLEHVLFFASAVVFWWPLVGAAPRLRAPAPYSVRLVYLVLAAFQSALLGLLLALSPRALYASYALTAGRWGLTPLEDQAWGGIVMWSLGGAIDMLAVLVLVHRYLASTEPRVVVAATGRPAGGD